MWWGGLSTGWRVNVLLYALATVSLLALVAEIASGGREPRRVEVAGQRTRRTTTTQAQAQATTSVAPTSSLPATTLPPVSETAAPTSAPRPAPTRPRQVASPPPVAFDPAPPPPTALPCRNGTDPRCGPFRWDPPAGPNQPLAVDVSVAPDGAQARFAFDVSDPDHPVTDNCASLDYGDGSRETLPCDPAPCPPTYGPWTPPPREPGQRQFVYRHTYAQPGQYTVRFTFRNDRDRCPDPYGGSRSGEILVTVTAGT